MSFKERVWKGFVRWILKKLEFLKYRVSLLGLVIGKYFGKKRLILNLNLWYVYEEIESVNNLDDKEKYLLKYVKIIDVFIKIKELI